MRKKSRMPKQKTQFIEAPDRHLSKGCSHNFPDYRLTSEDSFVYATYECSLCHGEIYHMVGERLSPNDWDLKQIVTTGTS